MDSTPHDTHHHEATESGALHVSDARTLWIVWAILMVLLFVTWGASKVNFGSSSGNLIVALVIAIIKTTLVVLYFMGVKYNSKLTWLWASIGFIWLLLLFGTLGDYVTREWIRLPEGW